MPENKEILENKAHSDSHWSRVNEKGTSLGMKVLLYAYKILGRPAFAFILLFVIGYFFLVGHDQRRAALNFHLHVKQMRAKLNMAPWRPQPFRQFLSFGFAALDKISAWTGSITIDDIEFNDFENIQTIVNSGRGGVILISHHGNMEITRAVSKSIPSLRINAVVHTKNAIKFNELLRKVAPDSGLNLIEVTSLGADTAVKMMEKIERGEFIVIVGDRTSVQYRERVVEAEFLGETALFPEGPFILSSILKCPIYFMACVRNGKKFYVDFTPYKDKLILDRKDRMASLKVIVQDYANWLEKLTLHFPNQWFNFFDFWQKPEPPAAPVKESTDQS